MWQLASIRHSKTGADQTRSHHRGHHRGFSHPMRFEVLEQRLPLAAFSAGGVEQNGVELVPGSIIGSNPAQPVLIAGNPNPTYLPPAGDNVAFNVPSWIPNDRTLNPIPFANETDLPMNIYQVAKSPRGVRNFEIGANTSLAHGAAPPMGRDIAAAARPSPVQPKFSQAIEHPFAEGLLDSGLSDDGFSGGDLLAENDVKAKTSDEADKADKAKFVEASPPVAQSVKQNSSSDDATEITPAARRDELACRESAHQPALDEAAVDQTMAEQEAEALRAGVPIASREITGQPAPRAIQDESLGIHAAAASVAIGITLAEPRSVLDESATETVVRAAKIRRARG